jgi:hypothetical protein
LQLNVMPNKMPQPTAAARPCRAEANAAQVSSQQLVSGPSNEAKWAWANTRGRSMSAAVAPIAAASDHSRPIR